MINWARVERTRIEDQKGGDLEDLIKDTLSQIASDPGIRVSPDPTQEHLAADSPGDALHPDPDGEPTRSVDHPSPPPTVPTPPRPRPPTAPGSGNTGTAPRPAAADGDPGGKRRGLSDQRTASRPHAEVETPVGVGARDRTSSKVKGWLKRLIGG